MSEFDGLRKHKKTQQRALVGLGSAALAAAVALPRSGGPNFPKGINKVLKKEKKKEKLVQHKPWAHLSVFVPLAVSIE